ncbi:hypothetical protein Dimus_008725 [Dionaea muscipula]
MEYLPLSQAQPSTIRPFLSPLSIPRARRNLIPFPIWKNLNKFRAFASNDGANEEIKLTPQDLEELKFGQMLGEDPKLTLAKIMGRKVNPDASYLEIEKNFYKNKGKIEQVKEVPFDVPRRELSAKANGLNLVRPVPKEGIKVGNGDDLKSVDVNECNKPAGSKGPSGSKSGTPNVVLQKPSTYKEKSHQVENSVRLNLVRPVSKQGVVVRNAEVLKSMDVDSGKSVIGSVENKLKSTQSSFLNVALRKPSMNENSDEIGNLMRLKTKPNLQLKMRTEAVKEEFMGMTLRKPETISVTDADKKKENPRKIEADVPSVSKDNLISAITSTGVTNSESKDIEKLLENREKEDSNSSSTVVMSDNPRLLVKTSGAQYSSPAWDSGEIEVTKIIIEELPQSNDDLSAVQLKMEMGSEKMQLPEQRNAVYPGKNKGCEAQASVSVGLPLSANAALEGKPRRPSVTPVEKSSEMDEGFNSLLDNGNVGNFSLSSPLMELEESDWARAERLLNSADEEEVELVSCSSKGFAVAFGSLTGFLPRRYLAASWKFLAFAPWLRKKGLDPSKFGQKLGTIESYQAPSANTSLESLWYLKTSKYPKVQVTKDMEVDDLFRVYEREKTLFWSPFVGQRINVKVSFVDKNSRKLIFSMIRKEKQQTVKKKRDLMARLSVGDVVKCHIKDITFFGVFVKVEGVLALIHQTEISWNPGVDPELLFKKGQVVEAKVHQLDFTLERIFLSLKNMTEDPLMDSVLEGINALNGFSAMQTNYEWPEVDELIKELMKIEKVHHVSRGRFFMSPGLAPAFQVYMTSVSKNEYKLLARSENKVQEVIVQASLNEDEMKAAILTCTNPLV